MISTDNMVDRIIHNDPRTVAQAISLVENEAKECTDVLRALFPRTGNAYRIGITGPPGAGKSTLTNELAKYYRTQNCKVGVIAVDPTSPFTGGALLGDRVRMSDVELDEGVFIRSMASRGSLGGLSKKAKEAADILDAAGYNIILMETVGVGQSELDIAHAVDTTVVVLVPESGDGIQAMKAGLMEIADLFVMNKADRPGADQTMTSIEFILGLRPHSRQDWLVRIVKTQAHEGKGVAEVVTMIDQHRSFLQTSNTLVKRRKIQLEQRIHEIINEQWHFDFWTSERAAYLTEHIEQVFSRSLTPYDVAQELILHFK
ncbi:MAG: methylmalonyl Co-A mutase-associated GTPase MeaB [Bacteroidota bacterium]